MRMIRLDRLLANLGYGSRREIAHMVRQGRILLNGRIVKKQEEAIALLWVRNGLLTLDGEAIDPPAPLTLMFHKPQGYSCSHDEKGPLVYDLLPERWRLRKPAISCAGRLDKDSTGQVILTDDGDLLHRIIHPKRHAEKHYAVRLAHTLRGDEAALFASGTFCMRNDVKPLKPAAWIAHGEKSGTMILSEGRYHQIRRMFETLGNQVVALHRYRTGGLALGDLDQGTHRILDETDIEAIFARQPAIT